MIWYVLHPDATPEHLGFIPSFLNEDDPDPAAMQIDKNYQQGGGWQPLAGFTFNRKTHELSYPNDPPLHPLALALLRDEAIVLYEREWLLVLQPDGSYEVARVD